METTAAAAFARLRLKQLALVTALDRHRSLRKAASELAMTQSAASKALREIEAVLGAALFERTRAGIEPNALGRCVIRYAGLLRADVGAMLQEMDDIRAGRGGRLAVGAVMSAVPRLLCEVLLELRREEPQLRVEVFEDTSARLLAQLDQGQLDVVVGRATVSPQPALYRYELLQEEPLGVAVGPAHPLARLRKVGFADLAPFGWVVYPSQMPMRVLLEREFADAGIAMPRNVIETASTFATVALLSRSPELVAVLPKEVCDFFTAQRMLRVLPVPLHSRSQPVGIVTRAGVRLPEPAQRFVEALRRAAHGTPGTA
ncbi:LysR family transcriptional regulator [Caldimonas tepidiphila]|uniref:LysR family transcriptional regulator n=1 Tax=Caldimonas tepidiphila TaxID=2315841 RepID=UPI000E5B8EBC|nr:LysR family transcriptional regulator [Caldimonas tepidiphila]